MTRQERSFKRDMTFHLARRAFGVNIPATDIDFLEYDHLEPIFLWELKSEKSRWKQGVRTAGIIATWRLAKKADLLFFVVEHNDDFSILKVFHVTDWKQMLPVTSCVATYSLKEFIEFLYLMRNRPLPDAIPIPLRLEAISFSREEKL